MGTTSEWKERLQHAIMDCGKSHREISLAAGLGPGYLHSVFVEGKEPTVTNVLKICRAADISVYRVLAGFEITPEDEDFLRLVSLADADLRRSLLYLLERGVQPQEKQEPPGANPRPRSPTRA